MASAATPGTAGAGAGVARMVRMVRVLYNHDAASNAPRRTLAVLYGEQFMANLPQDVRMAVEVDGRRTMEATRMTLTRIKGKEYVRVCGYKTKGVTGLTEVGWSLDSSSTLVRHLAKKSPPAEEVQEQVGNRRVRGLGKGGAWV